MINIFQMWQYILFRDLNKYCFALILWSTVFEYLKESIFLNYLLPEENKWEAERERGSEGEKEWLIFSY